MTTSPADWLPRDRNQLHPYARYWVWDTFTFNFTVYNKQQCIISTPWISMEKSLMWSSPLSDWVQIQQLGLQVKWVQASIQIPVYESKSSEIYKARRLWNLLFRIWAHAKEVTTLQTGRCSHCRSRSVSVLLNSIRCAHQGSQWKGSSDWKYIVPQLQCCWLGI